MKSISTFLFFCIYSLSHAAQLPQRSGFDLPIGFTQNKGQFTDEQGRPYPAIKYIYQSPGLNVILKDKGFSLQFYTLQGGSSAPQNFAGNSQPPLPVTYNAHRIDLDFLGSSSDALITAEGSSDNYFNYFKQSQSVQEVTDVHQFARVIYHNIYPFIDLVFTKGTNKQLKYDWIVRPGGRVSDIRLRIKGQDAFAANSKVFILKSAYGQSTETLLKSYLQENNMPADIRYQFDKGILSYRSEQDTYNGTLVIDPWLQWSTCMGDMSYGGLALDMDIDSASNLYIAGSCSSLSGVSTDTFKTKGATSGGAIIKMDKNGYIKWVTYFGGPSISNMKSISVAKSGHISIGGTSTGTGLATPGAYQTASSGATECVVARFSSNGKSLIWSTYFGGGKDDYFSAVRSDEYGNTYLCGWTNSTSGIATPGAYQTALSFNNQDGFIAKFNLYGKRIWATYTPANSLAGVVASGRYIYSLGGVLEVFKMDTAGKKRLWTKAFGPNSTVLAPHGLAVRDSLIYIAGGGSVSGHNGSQLALGRFDTAGNFKWSRWLLGNGGIVAKKLAIDRQGSCYMAGFTFASDISTKSAWQSLYGGGYDGYIVKYTKDGVRKWCSYVGDIKYDELDAVVLDTAKNIYVAGKSFDLKVHPPYGTDTICSASSQNIPELLVVKLQEPAALTQASVQAPSGTVCRYSTLKYSGPVRNSDEFYLWRTKGGKLLSDSTLQSVNIQWIDTGNLSLTLVIYNVAGDSNSAALKVRVEPLPAYNIIKSLQICEKSVIHLATSNSAANKYLWVSKDSSFIDTLPAPSVKILKTTRYYLTVTSRTTGCISKDSVLITTKPRPHASVHRNDTAVCLNTTALYYTHTSPNELYKWTALGNLITGKTTDTLVTVKWTKAGWNTLRLVTTNFNGCSDTALLYVWVEKPLIDFYSKPACAGNPTLLTDTTSVKIKKRIWKFGDGTMDTSNSASVSHLYANPNQYTVSLYVTSALGCVDSFSKTLVIPDKPAAAFEAPNECLGQTVVFTNKSANADSYVWVFGDGDSSFSAGPQHVYKDSGAYHVTFIVAGSNCTDILHHDVIIYSAPAAGFYTSGTCFGDSIRYFNTSAFAVSYLWKFGDGDSSVLKSPKHIFKNAGVYRSTLFAVGTHCTDTSGRTITIYPLPSASFSISVDSDRYISAKADQSSASGYHWDFGDGSTASGSKTSHKYAGYGFYTVRFTLSDVHGCTNEHDTTFTLHPNSVGIATLPSTNLRIYPNPSHGSFNLEYYLPEAGPVKVAVCDELGKAALVVKESLQNSGWHREEINPQTDLPKGIYFLSLTTPSGKTYHRIIIE